MTNSSLEGTKVAFLVANGFEELHMTDLQKALLSAGAQCKVISPEPGLVNGWHENAWGHYFPIDSSLASALSSDYEMLVVPGGSRSVNKLADNQHTKRIVQGFVDAGKTTVLLGEAVELLAVAEKTLGRTVTGTAASQAKLADATWTGSEIEVDNQLVTAIAEGEDLQPVVDEVLRVLSTARGLEAAA